MDERIPHPLGGMKDFLIYVHVPNMSLKYCKSGHTVNRVSDLFLLQDIDTELTHQLTAPTASWPYHSAAINDGSSLLFFVFFSPKVKNHIQTYSDKLLRNFHIFLPSFCVLFFKELDVVVWMGFCSHG